MPELRHDPIQDRWVVIAPERSRPPEDFPRHDPALGTELCPFCEGNESKTGPEILALRPGGTPPNRPGWQVRVVPNKFPALRVEGMLERRGVGVYDWLSGVGAHEVVIETPQHQASLADLPADQVARVLWTYRERQRDLMRDRRLRYVLVLKNHGRAAGASLLHSHTQVIATPVTPSAVAVEIASAVEHYRRKERCLFCDVIAQELDSGERIISSTDRFVALAPYASRCPFEVYIAPRQHHHSFADVSDETLHHLARGLKDILLRIKAALGDPPLNFAIHTAPNHETLERRPASTDAVEPAYHWHLEIMPRMTLNAGFDWGSGLHVNPTPPEQAARFLREVEL